MRGLGGELLRYLVASAVALGIDGGLLVALTEWAGVPYYLSAAIGFTAGLAMVYTVSVTWVFRRRTLVERPVAELVVFVGIGVVGLAVNEAILTGLTEWAGLHYAVSKALSVGVVFSWNFAARKLMLFAADARQAAGALAPRPPLGGGEGTLMPPSGRRLPV